jgi:hypothetical protein
MAESNLFDGAGLEEALRSGDLKHTSNEFIAMVKASDQKGFVDVALAGCDSWVALPTKFILSAEKMKSVKCKDHVHILFKIVLTQPEDPLAKSLIALITSTADRSAEGLFPDHRMQPYTNGTEPPSSFLMGNAHHVAAGDKNYGGYPTSSIPPSTSARRAGGFGGFGGLHTGGLNAWGCWDSCCGELKCTSGRNVYNWGTAGWMWVCDSWYCTEPCERCLWPW